MVECYQCGKPTTNHWSGLCDECKARFSREMKWRNEQPLTENITCPWCGYEDPDSWEMHGERDEDYRCAECGKPFVVECDISYSSYRKAEDMPEGWDGNDL